MPPERSLEDTFENKVRLLRKFANVSENFRANNQDAKETPLSFTGELHDILQDEILYSYDMQLPVDILELCSGEVLGKVGIFLREPTHMERVRNLDSPADGIDFWTEQRKRALVFLDELEQLTINGNSNSVAEFLASNRKMIGFCADFRTLNRLGQLLAHLYTDGLLEKDSVAIAHYPGSFNPFPHVGHAEVAERVIGSIRLTENDNPRVVVSTVSRTEEKSIEGNFTYRVSNLVKGFADSNYVSVLGVPSDLTKQEQVVDFRNHIAKLDAQGKTRHVMGSDTLISRIAKARNGDLLSNYLINSGATIYLSIRSMDDYESVLSAINTVKNEFDSELVILPDPEYQISGTMVRALDQDKQRQFFASMHIK